MKPFDTRESTGNCCRTHKEPVKVVDTGNDDGTYTRTIDGLPLEKWRAGHAKLLELGPGEAADRVSPLMDEHDRAAKVGNDQNPARGTR